MSVIHMAATERQERLINARLSVKRAAQHLDRFPHATSSPLVKDLKDALAAMIAEVEKS